MLAAIEEHLHPLRVKPDDEVLAVRDDRHADATCELAPFPQLIDIPGDVRFLELTTVFTEPILGQFAVGSSRCSVDLDVGHETLRIECQAGALVWTRYEFGGS